VTGPRVVEVPCGQALAPSLLSGYDWALNPYRGCAFDCLYCYAPDVVRIDRAQWAQTIFVKRSAPTVLAREVRKKPRGVVGVSTVTDPYQPLERRLEVTRRCLEVLARAGWPVSVLTKGPLVTRDLDILSKGPENEVGFSIATGDDGERKRWESRCPSVPARFEALAQVAQAGVRAYVFAGPLYPESSPASMRALAAQAAQAGAAEVMADSLHARPGTLSQVLDEHCPLPQARWPAATAKLTGVLEDACHEHGVAFSLARNWKPRGSGGHAGGHDRPVPARAAVEHTPVVEQPREVGRARAPLADRLALDPRLEEFD
jgi:DNA repair photolyase